jgi:hypothetical protein
LQKDCIPGKLPDAPVVILTHEPPTPTIVEPDRVLYKRTVREKNPDDPKSKRRIDYKPVKNPKPDTTYYAKINGKWQEVPAAYADPTYQLPAAA